jgi:hypothetical protein
MSKSADYLIRCLDVHKTTSISEETLSIMFVEYAKLVCEEKLICPHPLSHRTIVEGKEYCIKYDKYV